jgi:beta-fructofuranosidase
VLELADRWVWDFWHVRDRDVHHLFFLAAPRALDDPDLRHWHATVGHATSTDLRNWTVLPDALGSGDVGSFDDRTTWTGSVVRAGDDWVMGYTGTSDAEDGMVQRIGIARSSDLVTWTRRPDAVLEVDATRYEVLDRDVWHDQAWRDPWLYRQDGRWHCLLTARLRDGEPHGRGVVAHAVSDDLEHWEVGAPVTTPMGLGQLEVPQLCNLGGRWQLLFCSDVETQSDQARVALPGTGTYHLVADDPLGPFTGPPLPLDAGPDPTTYAGRIVEDTDGTPWFLAWERTDAAGRFVGRITDPRPVTVDAAGRLHVTPPVTRRG